MGLTATQRKSLRQALCRAYLNEGSLQLMLEDELDFQLNNIPTGETYERKVANLIKWAVQEGKLRELVIGASKSNPGNPELRSCVSEFISFLIDDIRDNLLSHENFTSLINILKDFQDFAVVKECCNLLIPDLSAHRPQEVLDIEKTELEPAVKWLIVLGLFIKDYRQKADGNPYIIDFVDCLRRRAKLQPITHQALSDWLKQVKPCCNDQISNQPNQALEEKVSKLQGRLQIVVDIPITTVPVEDNNTIFLVNWFICIETVQQDGFTQRQCISPSEIDSSVDSTQISQPGVFCDLKQIEKSLLAWVHQAETKLGNEAEQLDCSYDLTIDFFLPYDYLAEAVDQWKVQSGPERLQRVVPIGKKHRVVVHSQDRLENSDLLNELHKTWQAAEKCLQKPSSEKDIQAKIEQLDCPLGCDWEELTRRLQINQQIALKLTCAMPTCTTPGSTTDALNQFFVSILDGGTPIALWSRQCNLSSGNVKSQMEQLLTLEKLRNLDELLEQVKRMRRAGRNEQDLGYHLAILCDEPQRLRQIKQLLKENPLWGMSV